MLLVARTVPVIDPDNNAILNDSDSDDASLANVTVNELRLFVIVHEPL